MSDRSDGSPVLHDSTIERLYMVDLDVVTQGDETAEDAAALLAQMLLITFDVLTEHGPAGGWPVVRFSGPKRELRELLARYDGALTTADAEPGKRSDDDDDDDESHTALVVRPRVNLKVLGRVLDVARTSGLVHSSDARVTFTTLRILAQNGRIADASGTTLDPRLEHDTWKGERDHLGL